MNNIVRSTISSKLRTGHHKLSRIRLTCPEKQFKYIAEAGVTQSLSCVNVELRKTRCGEYDFRSKGFAWQEITMISDLCCVVTTLHVGLHE